ncbi:EutN/CcmL family microcompartment protein [Candidatus Saccharibacteria bacterium]|nr:EutN/CcmL family microcompartment protein [Candidatus Saccharibacteria bacterium]NIV73218.1 hypothetical protein [Calditrichia bacterium]NIW78291.1 hypothetical protein [Calditrichia bacterium]
MILGKVCGQIYSTINHPFYDERRLLVIDILSLKGKPTGDYIIAMDAVGAGFDETVLVINEGNSARQVTDAPQAPVRSVVVGIVDQIQ